MIKKEGCEEAFCIFGDRGEALPLGDIEMMLGVGFRPHFLEGKGWI